MKATLTTVRLRYNRLPLLVSTVSFQQSVLRQRRGVEVTLSAFFRASSVFVAVIAGVRARRVLAGVGLCKVAGKVFDTLSR